MGMDGNSYFMLVLL